MTIASAAVAARKRRAIGVLTAALSCAAVAAAPRIAPVPTQQLSAGQRELVAQQTAGGGLANLAATYLHSPDVAASLLPFERYIGTESTLPARDREVVALRVAWVARSDYLWAHHAPAARRAGLDEADLLSIARGPEAAAMPAFDAALLRAVDEAHVDSFIADATWRSLAARYDERQLLDLVFTIGGLLLSANVANALDVEIEAGRDDRLPAGIAYRLAAPATGLRLIGEAPRIAPLEPDEWSPEVRSRLDPNGAGRRVANVYTTFARHLRAERLRAEVTRQIRDGTLLSDRHRELLLLRIGALCRAEYEWAAHVRIGTRIGLDADDLDLIAAVPSARPHRPDRTRPGTSEPASGGRDDAGAAAASPLDLALLRAADELYLRDTISTETWDALAPLGDRQRLEVVIAVAGYRMVSIAANSVGVQLDPDMADYRFPPRLSTP